MLKLYRTTNTKWGVLITAESGTYFDNAHVMNMLIKLVSHMYEQSYGNEIPGNGESFNCSRSSNHMPNYRVGVPVEWEHSGGFTAHGSISYMYSEAVEAVMSRWRSESLNARAW